MRYTTICFVLLCLTLGMIFSCGEPPELTGPSIVSTTGLLSIRSTPDGVAKLDGVIIGNTPIDNHELSTGNHVVEVSSDGYASEVELINVPGGDRALANFTLNLLSADSGQVIVYTLPSEPSAEVVLTGMGVQLTDTTLFNKMVKAGEYDIHISREGCHPVDQHFTLAGGQVKSFLALLDPIAGPQWVDTRIRPSRFSILTGSQIQLTAEKIYNDGTTKQAIGAVFTSTAPHAIKVEPDGMVTGLMPIESGVIEVTVDTATVFVSGAVTDSLPNSGKVTVIMDEPEMANIVVRDEGGNVVDSVFTAAKIFSLSPGKYLIHVSMDGYKDYWEGMTIESGSDETFRVTLQHAPSGMGQLGINSAPFAAEIQLFDADGNEIPTGGATTPTIFTLDYGIYIYILSKDQYEPVSGIVEVLEGHLIEVDEVLHPNPTPQTDGYVVFTSNPTGAEVELFDLSGQIPLQPNTTPLIVQLSAGEYAYKMNLVNYKSTSKGFNIAAGKTLHINCNLKRLPSGTGQLGINSSPIGARIKLFDVNGEEISKGGETTPMIFTLDTGIYIYVLWKDQYEPVSGITKVYDGQLTIVNEVLKSNPPTGRYIGVSANRNDVEVQVYDANSKFIGSASSFPYIFSLNPETFDPMKYSLISFSTGGDTLQAQVEVEAGSTQFVHFEFELSPPPSPIPGNASAY